MSPDKPEAFIPLAPKRDPIHIRTFKGTGDILKQLTLKVILVSNLVTYGAYAAWRDLVPKVADAGHAMVRSAHDASLGVTGDVPPVNIPIPR